MTARPPTETFHGSWYVSVRGWAIIFFSPLSSVFAKRESRIIFWMIARPPLSLYDISYHITLYSFILLHSLILNRAVNQAASTGRVTVTRHHRTRVMDDQFSPAFSHSAVSSNLCGLHGGMLSHGNCNCSTVNGETPLMLSSRVLGARFGFHPPA
jgi:hypothetical protein